MDVKIIVAILGTGAVSVVINYILNRKREKSELAHLKITDEVAISNTILDYSKQLKEDLQKAIEKVRELEEALEQTELAFKVLECNYRDLNAQYLQLKEKYDNMIKDF